MTKSGIARLSCAIMLTAPLAAILGACAAGERPEPIAAVAMDWRSVATDADRERLRNWRSAWMEALPQARTADSSAIAREGDLFRPDYALTDPVPPPGDYRCRIFKLGAKGTAMADFTAYPYFDCRIDAEGDVRSLYKVSGSQRPVGLLFADDSNRAIFLGTLMLGDERTALAYGRDAARDMAGVIERVGPQRWRLTLPYPAFESTLDVIELVPAG